MAVRQALGGTRAQILGKFWARAPVSGWRSVWWWPSGPDGW